MQTVDASLMRTPLGCPRTSLVSSPAFGSPIPRAKVGCDEPDFHPRLAYAESISTCIQSSQTKRSQPDAPLRGCGNYANIPGDWGGELEK